MAMSNGNTRGMNSEINVTPMIDVLLVLLIVFMVIVPALPRGESAQALKPQPDAGQSNPDAVVLEVSKGSGGEAAFRINQKVISKENLPALLASIYAKRAVRILFLKGEDGLSFSQVAEVIDIGHAAGVDHVGLMTPKVLASQ
jgi:biopolymer transport protein TolR